MDQPLLTPHAKYADALRRSERLSRSHPQWLERHSAMIDAAKELIDYEREHLAAQNFEREERLAIRSRDRVARLILRDAMYDQWRRARR